MARAFGGVTRLDLLYSGHTHQSEGGHDAVQSESVRHVQRRLGIPDWDRPSARRESATHHSCLGCRTLRAALPACPTGLSEATPGPPGAVRPASRPYRVHLASSTACASGPGGLASQGDVCTKCADSHSGAGDTLCWAGSHQMPQVLRAGCTPALRAG
jgi:hypothetical protein